MADQRPEKEAMHDLLDVLRRIVDEVCSEEERQCTIWDLKSASRFTPLWDRIKWRLVKLPASEALLRHADVVTITHQQLTSRRTGTRARAHASGGAGQEGGRSSREASPA